MRAACEQEVLACQRDAAQLAFGSVVVDLDASVVAKAARYRRRCRGEQTGSRWVRRRGEAIRARAGALPGRRGFTARHPCRACRRHGRRRDSARARAPLCGLGDRDRSRRSPASPRHCRSTPREECGSNAPTVARLGCRFGMRSHRRAMIRGANLREASFDRGALLRCQHRHDALAQGFYLRTRRARSRCERTAELLADFTNLQMLCARHVCRPHRSSDRRAMVSAMVTGGSLRGIGDADTGKCNTGDDSGAECASGR